MSKTNEIIEKMKNLFGEDVMTIETNNKVKFVEFSRNKYPKAYLAYGVHRLICDLTTDLDLLILDMSDAELQYFKSNVEADE